MIEATIEEISLNKDQIMSSGTEDRTVPYHVEADSCENLFLCTCYFKEFKTALKIKPFSQVIIFQSQLLKKCQLEWIRIAL